MPIGNDDLKPHLSAAEEAFRYGGQSREAGLDVYHRSSLYLD